MENKTLSVIMAKLHNFEKGGILRVPNLSDQLRPFGNSFCKGFLGIQHIRAATTAAQILMSYRIHV